MKKARVLCAAVAGGFVSGLLVLLAGQAHAQTIYFTNSTTASAGKWSLGNLWTNSGGAGITLGTTAANWFQSNLVFNTLSGETTNDVGTGASFGWVTWLVNATNRVGTAANNYYWTGFTNLGNNTVLFAPKVSFSNQAIAPVIYNEGQLTFSGVMSNRNITSALTFDSAAGATTTVSGVLGGVNVGLNKNGAGALVLSNANVFTTPLTLNAGTLLLGNNAALGTGTFMINGGTVDVTAARTTANNNSIALNGDFTFAGANTLQLGTGGVTLGGNYGVTVNASTLGIGGVLDDGINTFSLTKLGAGTLVLSNAANLYGGGTVIRAGVLQATVAGALPGYATPGLLAVSNGATLAVNYGGVSDWSSAQVDDLVGNTGAFAAGSLLLFDTSNGSGAYAGNITVAGLGVVKRGGNMLSLLGTNTFGSGVTVNAGTLLITNDAGLGATSGSLALNAAGLLVTNDVSLASSRSISLMGATTNQVGAGATLTINGNYLPSTGTLLKNGAGTLVLAGLNSSVTNTFSIYEGAVNLTGSNFFGSAASGNRDLLYVRSNAVLNMSGYVFIGERLRIGNEVGTTGIVNQAAGLVVANASDYGELLGNAVGSVGIYNLSGGILSNGANAKLTVGLNTGSTGIFNLAGGQLYTPTLEVGRNSGAAYNTVSYFNQSGGTATVGTLVMGRANVDSTNQTMFLLITNGVFNVTSAFSSLAPTSNDVATLYFGTGAVVTLPAFPWQHTNATVNLTFDGGTLSPTAASANYMSNLTAVIITTNGAVFDVPAGKDITVAQTLQDASGQIGSLIKQGAGLLALSGANSYSGYTDIRSGTLSMATTASLPGYNLNGRYIVSNGAALAVANGVADADINAMLATTNFSVGSLLGFDTSAGNRSSSETLVDATAGALGIAKLGANTLTLAGVNSFTGPININNGALNFTNAAALGAGGNPITVNSGTLWNSGDVTVNNRNLVLAGPFTNNADAGTTLIFTNPVTGTGSFVKLGSGTLVFSNAASSVTLNASSGFQVKAGTFVQVGGSITSINNSADYVANAAGEVATMVMDGSAVFRKTQYNFVIASAATTLGTLLMQGNALLSAQTNFYVGSGGTGLLFQSSGSIYVGRAAYVGSSAGAVGVVNQTGGSFRQGNQLYIANNPTAYGQYQLSAGVMTNANWTQVGAQGLGLYYQYGGTNLITASGFIAGNNGGTGVVYLAGGVMTESSGLPLWLGYNNASLGRGEFTVDGTATVRLNNASLMINRQGSAGTNSTGIVNLNGGLLQASSLFKTTSSTNTGYALVNFNGGVLQAGTNGILMGTINSTSGSVDAAYVRTGGAILDDGGYTVTISQNLLAAPDKGVTSLNLGGNLGGFVGAPYVMITGDGTGATAIAQADLTPDSPTYGQVTNLIITSAGFGYTTPPTVTLVGGGSTNFTVPTVTIGATGSGGLTKQGVGMLSLSGVNTYTGQTLVVAGVLAISNANAVGTAPVWVSNNSTLLLANDAGMNFTNTLNLSGNGATNQTANYGALRSDSLTTNLISGPVTISNQTTRLVANTGSLRITNGITGDQDLVLNPAGASSAVIVDTQPITLGVGNTVYFQGVGTNLLNVSGHTFGTAQVGYGNLLLLGANSALPTGASLVLGTGSSNGVVNLNGFNQALASLSSEPFVTAAMMITNSSATASALTISQSGDTAFYGSLAGNLSLTKSGAGTLTLAGSNTFSGNITNKAGVLVFTERNAGIGTAYIGQAAGDKAVMIVSNALSMTTVVLGGNATAAGAIYISGGAMTNSSDASTAFQVGNAGYGYMGVSAGNVTSPRIQVGNAATGVVEITGGSINLTTWLMLGRGGYGVLNVSGGQFNGPTGNNPAFNYNASANSFALLNVMGSGVADLSRSGRQVDLMYGIGNRAGIINVRDGGTLIASKIFQTSAGLTLLGFDGGTLQAGTTATGTLAATFLQGITNAVIYAGGARINTDTNNITIAQPLVSPDGSGVTNINLTGNGSGYIGAPIVDISGGGGTGATAIAQTDLTPGSATFGQVTNILITSAGYGYTGAPAVTLTGGKPTVAATVSSTASTGLNDQTGGLVKLGLGALTLSGANTYGGSSGLTDIRAGTLTITSTSALPGWNSAGRFVVSNGAALAVYNAVLDADIATLLGTGNFAAGARLGFDTTSGNREYTPALADTVAGALGVRKLGGNTLILSGNNTFTGPMGIYGGTLNVSNSAALGGGSGSPLILTNASILLVSGDVTLNNRPITGGGGTNQILVDDGFTLTGTNTITMYGPLIKSNNGTLLVNGTSNVFNNVWVNGGRLVFGPDSTNSFPAVELRASYSGSCTGSIVQLGGLVSLSGAANGLLIGNYTGSGDYTLSNGTLRALSSTANRGMMLGVNSDSTGTFTMVDGVVTGSQLQVSRVDGAGARSVGYYYQGNGTAGFASIYLAGGATPANSSNNVAVLAVTNGSFLATAFGGLSSGTNSTSLMYFGPGAQVTLPAFPAARGLGAYTELQLDGGTLIPYAASTSYLTNLTHAYITTNGATFNVGSGKDITIPQVLENPAGQSGGLTKTGAGALQLSGANTYDGGTIINGGLLGFGVGALPASGNVFVNSGGALVVSGAYATVNNWLGAGQLDTASAGTLAMIGDNSEDINLTTGSFSNLFLGMAAGTTGTYSGTLTPYGNTYRLGGGGGVLIYGNPLGAGNTLIVGIPGGSGSVIFTNSSNAHDATILNSGTLTINSDASLGAIPGSAITNLTVNGSGVLQFVGSFALDANRTVLLGSGAALDMLVQGATNVVPGYITGPGGLNKTGNGVLVLSGANDYAGGTTNSAGALVVGANNVLGTGRLVLAGGALIAVDASAYSLNNDLTISGNTLFGLAGTGDLTLNGATGDLGAGTRTLLVSNAVTTINNALSNTASLVKGGPGTLVLGGANSYGGSTTIREGTLKQGVAGTVPASSVVFFGDGTSTFGTLDLNGLNSTIAGLVVAAPASSALAYTNTVINLNPGKTLTISTLANSNIVNIGNSRHVVMSGGGDLNLSAPNGGIVLTGMGTAANTPLADYAGWDLSQLGNVTIAVSNIAVAVDNAISRTAVWTLGTNNTITASSMILGNSSGDGSVKGWVQLGQSNTLRVANLTLGFFKGWGTLTYADGLVNPVLTLTGTSGTDRADVYVGRMTTSGSGVNAFNYLTLTNAGSTINASINQLALGSLEATPSGANGPKGYFMFDAGSGVVDVNTALVGRITAGVTKGSVSGLLYQAGGTLNVNSNFVIAQNLGSGTTVGGEVTFAGGTAHSYVNILGGGGNSVLTLNGGTLEMFGNTLGASGAGFISNVVFQSGTLRNVTEINGGLTPLVKTGAGTLTLDTANTYSGGTLVSNGTLVVNNSSGLATGPNTVFLYSNACLQGTGFVGSVFVNSDARVAPGNSVGMLTVSNLTMKVGSLYDFEFNTVPTNDQIYVQQDVTILGGAFNFYQEGTVTPWELNGIYNLIYYGGSILSNQPSLSVWSVNTAPYKQYSFATNDQWITMTVADANYLWTGLNATDSYWTSNDNWNIPPSAGVPLIFDSATERLTNTNDFPVNTRFAGLTFSTNAGAYVLEGNPLNLMSAVENDSTNLQTLNLALVLDNADRPFNAYSNSLVINGAISETNGSQGLIKNGAYTLTLTASNTYTGGTIINAGTLFASNAFAVSRGPVAITNGALQLAQSMAIVGALYGNSNAVIDIGPNTLTFSQTVDSTYAGAITNTGGIVMSGTGALTLAGTNTFTGTTVINTGTVYVAGGNVGGGQTIINGGKFQIGDATNFNGLVTGNISNNATLVFANPSASTYNGVITGTNGFIKAGAGVLTLTAAQAYSGPASISNGTLQVAGSDLLPTSGRVTFTGPSTSTLDLQGYNQTISNLTFALQYASNKAMTNIVTGANSMLTINGAANLNFSTTFTNQYQYVDMSGLGGFTYNAPANVMNIGAYANGATAQTNVVLLAQTNSITAKILSFGAIPGNGPAYHTNLLQLGAVNSINVNEITNSRMSSTLLDLPSGGSLVLRGMAGGSSYVSNLNLSVGDNNGTTAQYHIFDVSAGTLDALVANLAIGRVAYRQGGDYSSFLMGNGSLIVSNITLGQYYGSNGFVSGTFSLNGGTVQAQTITMAGSYSNNGWAYGNLILSNGLLQAQTITKGASIGPGSGLVTWVAGMISNYDASSDLSVNGLTVNLVPGNDHVLHIGAGRTATLASALTNSGNLVKMGDGLLILSSNGTFSGDTIINAGTLQLNAPLAAQNSTISNLVGASALQFSSVTNAYSVGGIMGAFDTTLTNMSGNGITLTLGGGGQSLVYTHVFSDAGMTGAVIKAGSGDLTLMASNSYSGGSTVSKGRLLVGNADALGTGPITFSGGKLASDGATARLITNAISITVDSGWGDAVNNGVLTFTGPINWNNAISCMSNQSDVVVLGTVVTNNGNGGFEKIGAGTLTFRNTLLYLNNTSQNKGGTMVLDGSTWDSSTGLRINATTAGDTSRLVVTNNGLLYIHGNSSSIRIGYATAANSTNILDIYAGATSTNSSTQPGLIFRGVAGPLNIANLNAGGVLTVVNIGMDGTGGGAANNIFNFNGGTLRASANATGMFITNTISTIVLGGGAIIDDGGTTISIGSNLQGTPGDSGLIKLGTGVQTYTGSNTYNGLTDIRAGTLTITTTDALPGWDTASRYAVSNGAALAVYNAVSDANIATILGTGNFASGAYLGFDTTSDNRDYTPVINDLGGNVLGVVKLGANHLTLGTANAYSGGTLISGSGLIKAANNLALGSGPVTIASGAGLALTNGITLANNLTIAGTGPLGNGALRNVDGVNTVNGLITLSGAASIQTYSGTTFNLPGTINNGGYALTLAASDNTFISGAITNTGSLIKNNSGTLTLSGANTYSGGTLINSGLLLASNAAALGTGPVAITNSTLRIAQDTTLGGALSGNYGGLVDNAGYGLTINQDGNSTFAGIITNTGALIKGGAGTLTLSGTNFYTGPTTVNAGSLIAGWIGTTNSSGAKYVATITNNATLNFNIGSLTQFVSGTVSGSGTLNKWGAGMLTFSNANDYSGLTVVSQGVLSIHNGASLGSAAMGTVVSNGARLWIRASMTTAEPLTLTGAGTGTGGNTWGALLMAVGSGVLDLQGPVTLAGGAVVNSYASGVQTITFEQGLDGTGDLTLVESAAHNGSITYFFNGQSSYSGNTYVTNLNPNILGTAIQLGVNNGLPPTTILNLQAPNLKTNRAELALNGFNQTLAGLVSAYSTPGAFSSTNLVVNGAATPVTLTLNVSSNLSFDGQLGGAGPNDNNFALIKDGIGTQTLAPVKGPNTYTGGTVISNGTLKMGADLALPANSTLYADDLGVLNLNGFSQQLGSIHGSRGTITDSAGGGNLTVNFASGTQSFLGTVTGASTLTLTGGGTLEATAASTFGASSALVVSNGSTLLMNGTHSGVITTYGGSTNGGIGTVSTLNVKNNGVFMPGATLGLGTQTVHNLTLNPGGLLAVGLTAASNGLARVDTTFAMTNALLQLNLANYSYVYGQKITLVDYTGSTGFDWNDSTQLFTLNDVGGPSNSVLWAQDLVLPVMGGTSSNNFFRIDYNDLANGGHAITLTAIPEPGTASLLGLVGIAFLLRRIRRWRTRA